MTQARLISETIAAMVHKRAAIYVRVSARRQEVSGTSLHTQEELCRKYCQEHGYSVDETHIYREVHTGKEYRERPQLILLRQAARQHEFDIVVVFAFDRLARKQVHQAVIIDDLNHHDVSLECVSENFEDSAIGQFMRSVYAFMAEVEREKILERSARGKLSRVKDEKKMLGAGIPTYGYVWNKDRTAYEIHPDEAKIVKRIFAMAISGCSMRTIASTLTNEGIPTRRLRPRWDISIIQKILRNPAYIGQAIAFKSRQIREGAKIRTIPRDETEQILLPEGTIPPLIDKETFEKVQHLLPVRKRQATRNNKYPDGALLRGGYAKCGYCGGTMVAVNDHTHGVTLYRCGVGLKHLRECAYLSVTAHILDDAAWEYAKAEIQDPLLVAQRVAALKRQNPIDQELAPINRRLATIAQEQANLVEMGQYASSKGVIQGIGERLAGLEREQKDLEKEILALQDVEAVWRKTEEKLAGFERWCDAFRGKLQTATYEQKREALEILGIKVLVWRPDHKPRFDIDDLPTCVHEIKGLVTI